MKTFVSLISFFSLKTSLVLAFQFYGFLLIAQVPDKMSYQAVIRDAENKLVVNASIGMKISIMQGLPVMTSVYVETQQPSTNDNGMISIQIGEGTPVSGNLSEINWGDGPYFIRTEADPAGGTNYVITGLSQLLSVPYAFMAKTAEDAVTKSFVNDLILQLYEQGDFKVKDTERNTYNTVRIGNQIWMSENLRTTKYRNGDAIPDKTYGGVDHQSTAPWYSVHPHTEIYEIDTDEEVIEAYGLLYNSYAINNIRGICPVGWRIPSLDDWEELFGYVMNSSNEIDSTNVGNALKSCRQQDSPFGGACNTNEHPRWYSDPEHHGFDEFGFSALPGGFRSGDLYLGVGSHGQWWSSTKDDWNRNRSFQLITNNGGIDNLPGLTSIDGLSVRCIRNMDE
jgi:uncharacterized protein (TIGR02145 family)